MNREWESYYDLRHSSIRYDNGKVIPLPYIHSKDFWPLVKSDKNNILITSYNEKINQKDNDKYRFLITRQTLGPLRFPGLSQTPRFKVLLEEASAIKETGDDIAKQLGKKFYVLRYRYLDSWSDWLLKHQEYKQMLSIDFLAKKLPEIIPPGNSLYVMSNIWKQPDYFAQLRKSYRLFTYNDFPTLTKLIENKYPNTFLLLAIENYLAEKLSVGWFQIRAPAPCWLKIDRSAGEH